MLAWTSVEGLSASQWKLDCYILTFIEPKELMDLNMFSKVMSGGWNMKKDSVTIVRKHLERCVCVFVMEMF